MILPIIQKNEKLSGTLEISTIPLRTDEKIGEMTQMSPLGSTNMG